MKCQRRQIMIEPTVQGGLILRVATYWFFFLLTMTFMLLAWVAFSGPKRPFSEILAHGIWNLIPAYVGSFIALPIILVDIVRFSNRFAGPIQSLKRGLSQVAQHRPVGRIRVRKNDFWADICDEFNAAVEVVGAPTTSEEESSSAKAEAKEELVAV